MSFAAAISQHPEPATATGEVAGQLLDQGAEGADLLCVFVTPPFAGALEDMAGALATIVGPEVSIGCCARGVIGSGQAVVGAPAISAWAGHVGPVAPARLEVVDRGPGRRAIDGWPLGLPWVPVGAVLLSDIFGFPIPPLFATLNDAGGYPRVAGGMLGVGDAPGTNRFWLDGTVFSDGAVGVLIGASDDVMLEPVVSPGTRPIGEPFTVTSAKDNVVLELGGSSPWGRLTAAVQALDPDDAHLVERGVMVGLSTDDAKGVVLVRAVLGGDPEGGAITVGEYVEVGTTMQFHVPDEQFAATELERLLLPRPSDSALLFANETRRGDDSATVIGTLGRVPMAGCLTAAEFGAVRSQNHVHGTTASLALFNRRP